MGGSPPREGIFLGRQRKGDTAIKQKWGWAEVHFLKGMKWKLQSLYPDGLNSQKKLEKT